jgi:ADP-heptose:LPS heptosyltransferase
MRRAVGQDAGRGDARLRLLDQTLGVGLIALAGHLRRRRRRPNVIRRIGIMKSAAIGDMILASGVIHDVAAAFPAAEVVVFAGPDNEGAAKLLERVRVVVLPMAAPWTAIRRLRREKLDVLLDLGQWTRLEALCSFLSGARFTVGFATPGQRRHFVYDEQVPHSSDVHELENFQRLVRAIGVDSRTTPTITIRGSGGTDLPTPYVVFHMWPGGYRSHLKEWPEAAWHALASRLGAVGFSIVLTGSRADAQRTASFVDAFASAADVELVNCAGRYGIEDLVDVLRSASCVVSVNTGVMHLAAAVGAPTVALNGPTNEVRWGPVGARAVSVNSDLPGCGYLNLGFEYEQGRVDCMQGISVERVVDAVTRVRSDG